MSDNYPFGNDPAKVEGYRKFWERVDVPRPLVGFSIKSWFPLEEFEASRRWIGSEYLAPEMVDPEGFLDDQERLLAEGEWMDDDILRGASPSQAVPWLCAMMGGRLRILPGSILAEEMELPWEEIESLRLEPDDPWLGKYLECVRSLVRRSAGRFPVTHGTLVGPSDLLAMTRGHTRSLYELYEEPEHILTALRNFAAIFREITEAAWREAPCFLDGWFDAQYQLWSPGPIVRMQEDAAAVFSPELYRKYLLEIDREPAAAFPNSFMHLHSTSMHILDELLSIEELSCFEVNYEVGSGGPSMDGMVDYYRRIQEAEKSLVVRGSFTPDEVGLMLDSLEPRGLYIYVMVTDREEAESLKPLFGM